MPKEPKKPAYQRHATGQAKVRIDRKDHYLGLYGSEASHRLYDELMAEWATHHSPQARASMTVGELALLYLDHARGYYQKDGRATSEIGCIRLALRPLVEMYRTTACREFSPLKLKAVRQHMVDAGIVRVSINRHVGRIRRMFAWAVSEELLEIGILNALQTVQGLAAGRTKAVDNAPVKPVAIDRVDAIEPFVSRPVWGAVQVQLLTGMRPGEVLAVRGCDLNMAGKVWEYVPASHKTEHHGLSRTIYIGPKAQAVLRTFLRHDLGEYLFSPRDGREEWALKQTGPGRRMKTGTTNRKPTSRYSVTTYAIAIRRACERAFDMPDDLQKIDKKLTPQDRSERSRQAAEWRRQNCWHPHQLRHTAATILRREAGVETARTVLGHTTIGQTEIYAEADTMRAREIMGRVG